MTRPKLRVNPRYWHCRYCGARIRWKRLQGGERAPENLDRTKHVCEAEKRHQARIQQVFSRENKD